MQNIKLLLAYDGRAYFGWQKTASGPSIEERLEKALEKILQHPILLQAASRTDAGVHADAQVANFFTLHLNLNLNRLLMSLNRLLPKDIVVLSMESVPLAFHPTLHCTGKEYHYYVCLGTIQLPRERFYSWHVPYRIDQKLIDEAIPFFIGTHDFEAFSNATLSPPKCDYIREVQSIECTAVSERRLCFKVKGNHFLYKMVRNIVGTLTHVGRGKISPESIRDIIKSRKRINAGVTAPAQGLFLHSVYYD